ncbi:MAG: hypothetical protein OXU20_01055 [Myxococcales bacterium]|nr:hypothetical protein [Myxococcales bacterium]MDD9964936.1 hypothetical protein [Myxococcales bacterium]
MTPAALIENSRVEAQLFESPAPLHRSQVQAALSSSRRILVSPWVASIRAMVMDAG